MGGITLVGSNGVTLVGTNGITFTGPVSFTTNTAGYIYQTNFVITQPALGQYITNLTGARVYFRGQVVCHAQSSTSTGASAQYFFSNSNQGTNDFGSAMMGINVLYGMVTNQETYPINDVLAPGDYFQFQTSTSGTGSFVEPTNFSFTVAN